MCPQGRTGSTPVPGTTFLIDGDYLDPTGQRMINGGALRRTLLALRNEASRAIRKSRAVASRRLRGLPRLPDLDEVREMRLHYLRRLVDLEQSEGLEIGAGSVPLVRPADGSCEFADFRSEKEQIETLGFPEAALEKLTYVLERGLPVSQQIPRTFDYIVLCHVIEHIPDPLGYISDLMRMLRPGGRLMLAVPDKRCTPDASRPSTSLEMVLDAYHRGATTPALWQVLEMTRAWEIDFARLALQDVGRFYEWGSQSVAKVDCDAHCNVWADYEFNEQIGRLITGGMIGPAAVAAFKPQEWPFIEFFVVLERTGLVDAGSWEGQLIRSATASPTEARVYLVENEQKRWIVSPAALVAKGFGGRRIHAIDDAVVRGIPEGPHITED